MGVILKAENISKQYRLGLVGTGTLSHDLNRFWARIRGKEDPYLKVGAVNDRATKADSQYVWALKDISFEVQQGEILGIIGKNGAGKSTLLKLLSRVTSPTTGVIKTKGRIASLLEVGTGFHPELTGRENVFLNGAILGMRKQEITAKIDEIVEFSGCQKYIDTPVKRYSSGMRVRLAFAVAAHLEPDILIVDEVLAVGDAEFQKKAIGKMQDISKGEGRTVLFVSHNMAAVQNLCSRAILLEDGFVKYEGNTKDVVEKYLINDNSENNNFNSTYVKSVKILNQSMQQVDKLMMGSNFTIEIIASNIDVLKGPHLGFFIFNSSEQKITAFSTAMKKVNLVHEDGIDDDVYYFNINNPNLNEGTYYLDITVAYKTGGRVDYITKSLSFDVIAADVYGSGVLLNNHFGNIYLDVETIIKAKK